MPSPFVLCDCAAGVVASPTLTVLGVLGPAPLVLPFVPLGGVLSVLFTCCGRSMPPNPRPQILPL